VSRRPRSWLLAILWVFLGCGGQADAPSPTEITDRSWRAHEVVIAAGENAKTCAEAGAAMQAAFARHRQAFVDGLALDRDRERLRRASAYIEQQGERYHLIEVRMKLLSERCGADATVAAAFRQMEAP
jgi:hypothetical protein